MSFSLSSLNKCYIIAEISANHGGSLEYAEKTVRAAKRTGADAVKLQTYTPDTITLDCNSEIFRSKNPLRNNRTLYSIYEEGMLPWEWHEHLFKVARSIGIDIFSSPFDPSAVDFLENLNCPCYKVASFELIDIPLLKSIAKTKKPVIMSTGMGTLAEIDEAVNTLRTHGTKELALLKCTSSYPAPIKEANLLTIPNLSESFNCIAGLSDHTLGSDVAIASVALGAKIVEKHFILDKSKGGLDADFSMDPSEFTELVKSIRNVEAALGKVSYTPTEKEQNSRLLRKSLFIVKDIKKGEAFTANNLKSIRPGQGLHSRHLDEVIGKKAKANFKAGTPLSWDKID